MYVPIPKSSIFRASSATLIAGGSPLRRPSSVWRATVSQSNAAARARPRAIRRSRSAASVSKVSIAVGDLPGDAGVDEERRVAGDLGDRPRAGGDDRGAGRHRLQHRQPEPLVERREDEARRPRVERRQVRERHVVREHDVVAEPVLLDRAEDAAVEPRPRPGQDELGRGASRAARRRRTPANASIRSGRFFRGSRFPTKRQYGTSESRSGGRRRRPPPAASGRANSGPTASWITTIFWASTRSTRSQIGLRRLRHGDDAVRRPRREPRHEPHVEAVLPRHGLGEEEGDQVVDRDDGPVAELHVRQEDGRPMIDVGAERAEPERQVGEEPEIPAQVVLEGHARRRRGDVRLGDGQPRAIGRHQTGVAVPLVDRRRAR